MQHKVITATEYGRYEEISELVDKYLEDPMKKKEIKILKKTFPLLPYREIIGNWIQVSEMNFQEWLPVQDANHARERVSELFESLSIEYFNIGRKK